MGIRHTVGAYHAIAAEVVVRGIIAVEVAAVGINFHAALASPAQRLVNPIPYKTALQRRVPAYQVPILLETAARVAHCVGIFALYERLGGVCAAGIIFHALVIGIHGTEHVGKLILTGLLILHGAARVFGLNPFIHGLEVRAETSLVAHRPEYDARVVEIALHIALVAFHVRLGVCRVFCKRLVAISHAVRLDVGLGNHVQPIAVAQLIPAVIVGIVARAHGVYIQLFHKLHVLQHTLV